jgi:hypothetical protein
MSELKVSQHATTKQTLFEILHGGEVIAAIYPGDLDSRSIVVISHVAITGERATTKHRDAVQLTFGVR